MKINLFYYITLVENEIQCDLFYASFRHTLKRNHF